MEATFIAATAGFRFTPKLKYFKTARQLLRSVISVANRLEAEAKKMRIAALRRGEPTPPAKRFYEVDPLFINKINIKLK